MSLISFLKRLPIDLGQANLRGTTKGKQIALEHVKNGNGLTALDVGCREGMQSEWLKSKNYTVTSVDIEKIYDHAIIIDANKTLPFENSSFDLIWCSEVIEHLINPKLFEQEALRLLRPGGRLIITTPNSNFWLYFVARIFGKSPRELQNPTHLHFFSIKTIRTLFPDARLYGFFPYFLLRLRISRAIGILSPTFVIIQDVPKQ
jgi:2-polyprenyl-3-methyl-5-hydroxy-6-metoxy-1,4-benzoquinol methylase